MIIVEPQVTVLANDIDKNIELMSEAAAICYRTDLHDSMLSRIRLIQKCVHNNHWSPIEQSLFAVKILCDRGVANELVRHRLASFNQESTRYCNYFKERFNANIRVICPSNVEKGTHAYTIWQRQCDEAEHAYFALINNDISPESARSVLPICLATEIQVCANLREWYHICELRTDKSAHPDMRVIAKMILMELNKSYPMIFGHLI